MSALKKYTIVINDQRFTLLRDQIMRDAPNYFTAFFEGPFQETSEGVREMTLYRDPYLFKFIHLYLSGYDVLPLPKDNIPIYFSEESRLKNLLLDARFYGLDALAEELEAAVSRVERSGNSGEAQDGNQEGERWKVLTRGFNGYWDYWMTLYDRDALSFYMEEMKRDDHYLVFPMDVSRLSHEMGSIYTYRLRQTHPAGGFDDWYFAIGKVKET